MHFATCTRYCHENSIARIRQHGLNVLLRDALPALPTVDFPSRKTALRDNAEEVPPLPLAEIMCGDSELFCNLEAAGDTRAE